MFYDSFLTFLSSSAIRSKHVLIHSRLDQFYVSKSFKLQKKKNWELQARWKFDKFKCEHHFYDSFQLLFYSSFYSIRAFILASICFLFGYSFLIVSLFLCFLSAQWARLERWWCQYLSDELRKIKAGLRQDPKKRKRRNFNISNLLTETT